MFSIFDDDETEILTEFQNRLIKERIDFTEKEYFK